MAGHVAANGGVAALAARGGGWFFVAGAPAAATADTWATEIGRHSPIAPRLITNGRRVAPGTDGGMTLLGTAGGIVGAGFIAGLSYGFGQRGALVIVGAGVAGSRGGSVGRGTLQGKVRVGDD